MSCEVQTKLSENPLLKAHSGDVAICDQIIGVAEKEGVAGLEVLIKQGIDINIKAKYQFKNYFDKRTFTPILKALSENKLKAAEALFAVGADVNVSFEFSYGPTFEQDTPLYYACKTGYFDLAKRIIKRCSVDNINVCFSDTDNALTAAMKHPNPDLDLIQAFIDADANLERPRYYNNIFPLKTYLECLPSACYTSVEQAKEAREKMQLKTSKEEEERIKREIEIKRVMIKKLSSESSKEVLKEHTEPTSITALLSWSVRRENLGLLRELIAAGANVNYPFHSNESPLSIAACSGLKEFVDTLIQSGAKDDDFAWHEWDKPHPVVLAALDINEQYTEYLDLYSSSHHQHRQTPFGFKKNRHYEVLDALLRAGFHANFSSCYPVDRLASHHPLWMAVSQNDLKLASIVLPYVDEKHLNMVGAVFYYPRDDAFDGNYQGFPSNCLLSAIRQKDPRMVKLLLDFGADTTCSNLHFRPLMVAIHERAYDIVVCLLENGAIYTMDEFSGFYLSALDAALDRQNEAIATLLLKLGAKYNANYSNVLQFFQKHALLKKIHELAQICLKEEHINIVASRVEETYIETTNDPSLKADPKKIQELIHAEATIAAGALYEFYQKTLEEKRKLFCVAKDELMKYIEESLVFRLKYIYFHSRDDLTLLKPYLTTLRHYYAMQDPFSPTKFRDSNIHSYYKKTPNAPRLQKIAPFSEHPFSGYSKRNALARESRLHAARFQRAIGIVEKANEREAFFERRAKALERPKLFAATLSLDTSTPKHEAETTTLIFSRQNRDRSQKRMPVIGCVPDWSSCAVSNNVPKNSIKPSTPASTKLSPAAEFIAALYKDDFSAAFKMIKEGVDLANDDKFSPLVYVLERCHEIKTYGELTQQLITLLLNKNEFETLNCGDCLFKDDPFIPITPLEYAKRNGLKEIEKLLETAQQNERLRLSGPGSRKTP